MYSKEFISGVTLNDEVFRTIFEHERSQNQRHSWEYGKYVLVEDIELGELHVDCMHAVGKSLNN